MKQTGPSLKQILLVAVLGLAYFFCNFHRQVLAVIGTSIASELALSDMQLASLGSALFYAYAAMQIPGGWLADRFGARRVIAASSLVLAVSVLWFALTHSYGAALISRALVGATTAMAFVPAMACLRRAFGDSLYGTMAGILVCLGQTGTICASAPLHFLNAFIGWRKTFIILGILTFVLCAGAWLLIPEQSRSADARSAVTVPEASGERRKTASVFSRGLILVCVFYLLMGGTRLSFQTLWADVYFREALLMPPAVSSVMITCVAAGAVFGAVVTGRISDRAGHVRSTVICSVIFAATWAALITLSPGKSSLAAGAIMFLAGIMGSGIFTVGFVCIGKLGRSEATGTMTGIANCAAFIGSAAFTQLDGLFLGAGWSSPLEGFRALLAAFVILCLIASAAFASAFRK